MTSNAPSGLILGLRPANERRRYNSRWWKSPNLYFQVHSLMDGFDLSPLCDLLSQGLHLGSEPNVVYTEDESPLSRAIMFGDNEAVERFLKEGTNVNILERFPDDILGPNYKYGFFSADEWVNCCGTLSPLHLAVHRKRYAIVEKLLQYGANPHLEDNAGRSALDYSIAWNDLDLVTIFMKNGAEVNAINALGLSPLHVALSCKADLIIPLLVENGADIDKRSPRNGYTPLFRAFLIAMYKDTFLTIIYFLVLANADLEIPCVRGTGMTETAGSAFFEEIRVHCFKTFNSQQEPYISSPELRMFICELYMLRTFAMAGAVVHKDMGESRSVTALYQDWERMEDTVQNWYLRDDKRRFIIDCIQLIKQRHVQPASLTELCRLRIRCTLRPDFQRKLAMLHLPKSTKSFLEMKSEFTFETQYQFLNHPGLGWSYVFRSFPLPQTIFASNQNHWC